VHRRARWRRPAAARAEDRPVRKPHRTQHGRPGGAVQGHLCTREADDHPRADQPVGGEADQHAQRRDQRFRTPVRSASPRNASTAQSNPDSSPVTANVTANASPKRSSANKSNDRRPGGRISPWRRERVAQVGHPADPGVERGEQAKESHRCGRADGLVMMLFNVSPSAPAKSPQSRSRCSGVRAPDKMVGPPVPRDDAAGWRQCEQRGRCVSVPVRHETLVSVWR